MSVLSSVVIALVVVGVVSLDVFIVVVSELFSVVGRISSVTSDSELDIVRNVLVAPAVDLEVVVLSISSIVVCFVVVLCSSSGVSTLIVVVAVDVAVVEVVTKFSVVVLRSSVVLLRSSVVVLKSSVVSTYSEVSWISVVKIGLGDVDDFKVTISSIVVCFSVVDVVGSGVSVATFVARELVVSVVWLVRFVELVVKSASVVSSSVTFAVVDVDVSSLEGDVYASSSSSVV